MSDSEMQIDFDRRNCQLDELPDGLAIETVMGCNLRCPMCPVPDSARTMGRTPAMMSFELYRKIIDQLSGRSRSVLLSILGEPLLHPRIVDFVKLAHDHGHRPAIITNATKLTQDLSLKLLDAGLSYIAVSIDGLERETYEGIRRGAAHSAVLANLLAFVELNNARSPRARVEINYVVSSRTAPEVDQFTRAFAGVVDKINFNPISNFGGHFDHPLEPEENSESRPAAHGDVARTHCVHLWQSLHISADGRPMLCCNDYKHASALSSVAERPLAEIWRQEIGGYRRAHVAGDFSGGPCGPCRVNTVPFRMSNELRREILRNESRARLIRNMLPTSVLPPRWRERRKQTSRPIGAIDIPADQRRVSGIAPVQGWALGRLGARVIEVAIHVDGTPVGAAALGFFRPDVGERHPGDGHSFSGFAFDVDSTRLSNGTHNLSAVATDDSSNTAVFGARVIVVAN